MQMDIFCIGVLFPAGKVGVRISEGGVIRQKGHFACIEKAEMAANLANIRSAEAVLLCNTACFFMDIMQCTPVICLVIMQVTAVFECFTKMQNGSIENSLRLGHLAQKLLFINLISFS